MTKNNESPKRERKNIEPSKDLWMEICDRITAGESLREVLESDLAKFPTIQTFFRWMDKSTAIEECHSLFGLSDQYARSLLSRASVQGDQVLEIADNPITEDWREKIEKSLAQENTKLTSIYMKAALQHASMRIDARKWHAARMNPKMWHLRSDSGQDAGNKEDETVKITGGLPDSD